MQKKINLPNQKDTYNAISKSNIVISPLSTIMIETILSGRIAVALSKEIDNPLFNKVLLNHDYLKEMLDEGAFSQFAVHHMKFLKLSIN